MHGLRCKKTSQDKNMITKKHKTHEGKIIISVCDSDLIDKVFDDGKLQIDLNSDFYKGENLDENKIFELLKNCYLAVFIGKKSVGFGIKKQIIDESKVIKIKEVPFAQVMFLE